MKIVFIVNATIAILSVIGAYAIMGMSMAHPQFPSSPMLTAPKGAELVTPCMACAEYRLTIALHQYAAVWKVPDHSPRRHRYVDDYNLVAKETPTVLLEKAHLPRQLEYGSVQKLRGQ